jgi:hypothetical protein
VVQEVDIAVCPCTFRLIHLTLNTFVGLSQNGSSLMWEWRSLEHVPISETYFGITDNAGNSSTNPFDYCHINSMTKDMRGNYIVSLRGPSTVYNISSTGDINWRLGGKFR